MFPSGGHTYGLSPSAAQTAIDEAMFEEYTREQQPAYLRASDEFFFKQDTTEKLAFIWEEDQGVSNYQATGEQEEILNSDTRLANQKTKVSQKYTKQTPISDEMFRSDMIGKRQRLGAQHGDAARRTQDQTAILETYGDAFAGSVNTTPDGQALASNSHVSIAGLTVDNLETGALNPDNLWTLVTSLANQRGQHGDAGSHVFEGILVPFTLYKTAKEVMNSALHPNSAENNLNIFDTDYGSVMIRASIFLGSTYNSATNANTSYHIISRNHFIIRKVRYGLESVMVAPEFSANDSYIYRSKYHESVFPGSWSGYAASNGSA